MEEILLDVNWVAVIVGAVLAFILGAIWYSPKVFGKKWMDGSGLTEDSKGSMFKPMLAQAVGTFLMAWTIGVTATTDSLVFAILITLTIAVLIKASGLFVKKSTGAVMIDATFIIALAVLMIAVHAFV